MRAGNRETHFIVHTPIFDLEAWTDVAKRRGISTDAGSAAIGKRLARLRHERGITQQEMSRLLGVTQPIVSYYERGTLRLHGEVLIEMARVLGVTADEILGLVKSPRPGKLSERLVKRARHFDRLSRRDQDAVIRLIDSLAEKEERRG